MAEKNEDNKGSKKGKNKILFIMLALVIIGVGTFAGVYLANKNKSEKEVVIEEAFYEIGEIFVNLDDANRYVRLNLTVSYDVKAKKIPEELEEKKIALKDAAIFYLKSCKVSDFDASNEKKLKDSIRKRLNEKLEEGTLIDIYISDIIVQ